MDTLYFSNAIVKYIYRECDVFERLEVEDAIENDRESRRLYQQLKVAFRSLPKAAFIPPIHLTENIISISTKAI